MFAQGLVQAHLSDTLNRGLRMNSFRMPRPRPSLPYPAADVCNPSQMRWKAAAAAASLESLLQALSATGSLSQIAQLHQHLLVRGLAAIPFVTTKLLQLYAISGDLRSALWLFSTLPHPSVFAWTPILALFSRSGDHLRCLAAYAAMRSSAVPPDGYVFPSVLRSSAAAARPSAVHADAIKFCSDAILPVRNALIGAYSKVGDTASARRVFDLTDGRDLVSWNSMICAYVNSGCIELALDLLGNMESDGCEPDIVTWNIATICQNYVTMSNIYARAGQREEAKKVRRMMEKGEMAKPSGYSWIEAT